MNNILIIGAGLSSSSLIRYFLDESDKENWKITVIDRNLKLIEQKTKNHHNSKAVNINALNSEERKPYILEADIVISMLPARFHIEIARDCIKYKTNLITPSYVSQEMKDLNNQAKEAGIIILNEIGVDPGIDHMSSMKIINDIHNKNGQLHIFESFTGGLVAPESDDNPWNYKFSWNPRNVVLAGQGGASKFIQEGKYKYIPYNKLFRRTEIIEIDNYGQFEGYANRDSLKYRDIYGLHKIPTIYRGTLRRKGFSRAWDCFVQLGATDDSYTIEDSEHMTFRDFINSFLPYNQFDSVELKLRHYLKIEMDDTLWDKLVWLDIFSHEKIGLKNATPAQILQKILERKWKLQNNEKDMLVMWHKFVYKLNSEFHEINSSMVYIGKNHFYTAMSDTVGLPAAICGKMILKNIITLKGVQIPIHKNIYNPVLKELEHFGIKFNEKIIEKPVLYCKEKAWA